MERARTLIVYMLALYTSWLPQKQIKVHRLAIRHHHHRMARQLVAVPAVSSSPHQ